MTLDLAVRSLGALLGGGLLLLTTIVLVRYLLEWSRTPGRAGLLPLHVFLVAASYDLMVLGFTLGIATRPASWRAAIIIPALALGLVAMFVMVTFQRRTYAHKRREAAKRASREE